MDILEFGKMIDESDEFVGLGIGDDCLFIQHTPTQIITQFSIEAITSVDWERLSDIMSGTQDPEVLRHMSRVVGYFSRIDNWNKSKIGELKDRHRGDYRV